jgi:hypothetical protein
MVTIQQEGKIVFDMLAYEGAEGYGYRQGLLALLDKVVVAKLGAVAHALDNELYETEDTLNSKFGTEEKFIQWYEFEKSLPNSKYFKGLI